MVTIIFYDLSGRSGGVTDGFITPCIFLCDSNIDVHKKDFANASYRLTKLCLSKRSK